MKQHQQKEGLTISPLVNWIEREESYRIMLQQLRRAIVVTAANGHSQHTYSPRTTSFCEGYTEQEAKDAYADLIIVTTGGDHTCVEDIVGLIHTYRRDMQFSNNSVMDTMP